MDIRCPACGRKMTVERLRSSLDQGKTWANQRLFRCTRVAQGGERRCPTIRENEDPPSPDSPCSVEAGAASTGPDPASASCVRIRAGGSGDSPALGPDYPSPGRVRLPVASNKNKKQNGDQANV